MKILINRKPVEGPWGGGNLFVKALESMASYRGHEVTYRLEDGINCLFMQDPRYDELGISINELANYKLQNPGTLFVHRVNECDARKGTNDMDTLLRQCSSYTDVTFFVSSWMKKYHESLGWNCKNTEVAYNGVNRSHFKGNKKINNGSVNIVTHHWSNNFLKGFDIYEFLDEYVSDHNATFTYIGRENGTFKNCNIIPPLHGKDLGEELGRYDVYISGSRFDPGPNHILEALSCNIPTYVHSDGGGAVEFAGLDFCFKDTAHLKNILDNFSNTLMNDTSWLCSWEDCASFYLDKIEEKLC